MRQVHENKIFKSGGGYSPPYSPYPYMPES